MVVPFGYKTVIVIPETQTQEKKDAIRFTGAELIEVPAVPYTDENNYIKYSGRLAKDLDKNLKMELIGQINLIM